MSGIISILIKDLKKLKTNKSKIIGTLLIVLLIASILTIVTSIMVIENNNIEKVEMSVVNNDKNIATQLIINQFLQDEKFSKFVEVKICRENEILGTETAVLIIPEGFSEGLIKMKHEPLQILLNSNKYAESLIIKEMFSSYSKYIAHVDSVIMSAWHTMKEFNYSKDDIYSMNELLSLTLVKEALNRGRVFEITYVEGLPKVSLEKYYVFAILIFLLMFTTVIGAINIIEDIENGIYKRILVVGGTHNQFLVAKMLYVSLIQLMEVIVFVIPITILLRDVYQYIYIGDLALYILLIIVLNSCMSVFLGVTLKSSELLYGLCNIAIFVFSFLGGLFIPIYFYPYSFSMINNLIPTFHIMKGIVYILNGYRITEIISSVMIIVGCIVGSLIVTFKRNIRIK